MYSRLNQGNRVRVRRAFRVRANHPYGSHSTLKFPIDTVKDVWRLMVY